MDAEILSRLKKISMLSENVLAKLEIYAGAAHGGILEVGPYVGGSTIALALGNRQRHPQSTIEYGAAMPDHPWVPSDDPLADLDRNLREFGVRDAVTIVAGECYEPAVRREALRAIDDKIGLLFVDADGRLAPTMRIFADYLADDALIIADDYASDGAPEKTASIRKTIDWQVRAGGLIELEVVEATWVGRLAGSGGRTSLKRRPLISEPPHCFLYFTDAAGKVLEDGIELGPPGAAHDDIRNRGMGTYDFSTGGDRDFREMRPALRFSTSDNTDPRHNGRTYEILLEDGTRECIVSSIPAADWD